MGMMSNPRVLASMLGIATMAPQESEAEFIGPRAKNWGKYLNRFKGLGDDIPRAEISDARSGFMAGYTPKEGEVTRLGKVYNHPELYENYPKAREWFFQPVPGKASDWSDETKMIRYGVENYPQKEPVLHEIFHGIGAEEGFSPGSSISNELELLKQEAEKLVKSYDYYGDRIKDLKNQLGGLDDTFDKAKIKKIRGKIQAFKEKQRDIDFMIDRTTDRQVARANYLNRPGEREARDIEARAGLSAEERKKIPPFSSSVSREVDAGTGQPLSETIKKMGVAAPVGAILAEELAKKRDLEKRFGGQVEESVNPLEYLLPSRLGGGMMSMGMDSLMQYLGR